MSQKRAVFGHFRGFIFEFFATKIVGHLIMIFSFFYMVILIPFLLSHRDFIIWNITQKAHISGLQLLEISKTQGISDMLDPDSVPDGCTTKNFTLRKFKCHMIVAKNLIV